MRVALWNLRISLNMFYLLSSDADKDKLAPGCQGK